MQYTLRVPTTEQYAYIEAEYEGDADGAVLAYQELTRAVRGEQEGPGLPEPLWRKWIDGYLAGNPGTVDEWAQMNEKQKWTINQIKCSRKRTNQK